MGKRRGRWGWGVFFTVLACLAGPWHAAAAPRVTIGFAMDGPWEGSTAYVESLRHEILALTEGEFDVRFPSDKLLEADWTGNGARRVFQRLLNDPDVDLVIALGVLVSIEASRSGPLPKPVISPINIDRHIQELPEHAGTSGVKNFTYLSASPPSLRDLRIFHNMIPYKALALLVNRPFLEAVPQIKTRLLPLAEELNFSLRIIAVDATAASALTQLPEDVDAVYVTPLLQLPDPEMERLIAGLIERRLPSFSLLGKSEVVRGILAGVAPESKRTYLARRVALQVQRILLGENPSELPVQLEQEERLTVNMATARAIDFSPRWDTLIEAELIGEERNGAAERLSLLSAVRRVVEANLDLAATRYFVEAGEQDVIKARSELLPQLEIAADGTMIDEDRAQASFGSQAERTLSGSLRLRQLLYSEDAWSNWTVQKHIQVSREQQLRQLELDLAQQGATAYLGVLRAKTLQRIQKDNLVVTRSNLELARARLKIGYSGPSEVYRWESQIATDRQAVIQADAQREQAQIALNRLLHRPAERLFQTEEIGLESPALMAHGQRLAPYLSTPRSFKTFRDFMVLEGAGRAPELEQFEREIAAQKRVLQASRRAFWVPDATLDGSVSHLLAEGGEGEGPSLSGLPLSEANDTDWTINVNLSLPLVTSGFRRADLVQSRKELNRLFLARQAQVERIDERIRSALHQARASFAGIALSRQASEAARKNLDLVTDSYSRGAVNILDLLDAQNAALVAEQTAANAVYDFLIDLMEVERAAGQFTFFISEEERRLWFERLEAFFHKKEVVE